MWRRLAYQYTPGFVGTATCRSRLGRTSCKPELVATIALKPDETDLLGSFIGCSGIQDIIVTLAFELTYTAG